VEWNDEVGILNGYCILYRYSFSKGTRFLVDTTTLDSISNGGGV